MNNKCVGVEGGKKKKSGALMLFLKRGSGYDMEAKNGNPQTPLLKDD